MEILTLQQFKNYFRWNAQDNVKYSYTSNTNSLTIRDQVIQDYFVPEDILRHRINSAQDSDWDRNWDESEDEEYRWDDEDKEDRWGDEEIWSEDDSLDQDIEGSISPGSSPIPVGAQELDQVVDIKRCMELIYLEEHSIASESELRELQSVKAFTTPKDV